ncbi:MAG TPA: spherulation-specific family 4 protein [Candidatus Nitrosotalea sp.]|nr:hypothetical protein [Nitrososphaerota archaeon]HKU33420.1 spherulation-specific family 4 protein [Candidatus Nitrosotalea sp.]
MEKKIVFALVILAVALSSTFFVFQNRLFGTDVHAKLSGTMQIIVVPYFSPTSNLWKTVYAMADEHPGTIKYVIINPCSGPCGSVLTPDWDNVISVLKSKGVKTLGYIFSTSENFSNINYYMNGPEVPTDGIFFDSEGSTNNLANFKPYADYVHRLGGVVYINPGYNYTYVGDYLASGEADIANIYEIDSNSSHQIVSNKAYPPWKVSVIVGDINNSQEMKYNLSEIADKKIGISYMYADSYADLPTFFSNEVEQAASLKIRQEK